MSLKDIEKLKEKVESDPNSKLFVPLAEEYRKEGLLDEAISVLLNGIERQPGYTSARVSLGKMYLEKGMTAEARAEFENVIKIIPDNLFSQKKLAELYRDAGEYEMARKSYRTVLKLNAMDEDALTNLSDLEDKQEEQPAPEIVQPPPVPLPEAEAVSAEVREDLALPEEHPSEHAPAPLHSDEELSSFKEAIFGSQSVSAEEVTAEPESEEVTSEAAGEDTGEEEDLSFQDSGEEITEETLSVVGLEEETEEEELSLEDAGDDEEGAGEEISFEDVGDEIAVGEVSLEEAIPEMHIEEPYSGEIGEKTSVEEPLPKPEVLPEQAATLEDADRMVSGGNFADAFSIYRQILAANPDDRKVLQRIEDLRALMKLMGKDKEVLVDRLNKFLDGIKKRRDEFLRSP